VLLLRKRKAHGTVLQITAYFFARSVRKLEIRAGLNDLVILSA
jgi:hypothetical protein